MANKRILAKDVAVSNDTIKTKFNNNDIIIGSSGCAKKYGYIVPNLLDFSKAAECGSTVNNNNNNKGE